MAITMKYPQNTGEFVTKNFIIRDSNDNTAFTFCCRAKDFMTKYGGTLLFEKKLLNGVYYMVISFDSPDMMSAWESTVVQKRIMTEVTNTKVLAIKETDGNDAMAIAKCNQAKDLLAKCKGVVLREIKVDNAEYRLVLFFSDDMQMQIWEKTLGIC